MFLVGDGAKLCYNRQGFQSIGALLPPEPLIYQRACGVAKAAAIAYAKGLAVSPGRVETGLSSPCAGGTRSEQ